MRSTHITPSTVCVTRTDIIVGVATIFCLFTQSDWFVSESECQSMYIMATTKTIARKCGHSNFTEKSPSPQRSCLESQSQSQRIESTIEKTIKQILLALESNRFPTLQFGHLLLPEQHTNLWIGTSEQCNRSRNSHNCYQNTVNGSDLQLFTIWV